MVGWSGLGRPPHSHYFPLFLVFYYYLSLFSLFIVILSLFSIICYNTSTIYHFHHFHYFVFSTITSTLPLHLPYLHLNSTMLDNIIYHLYTKLYLMLFNHQPYFRIRSFCVSTIERKIMYYIQALAAFYTLLLLTALILITLIAIIERFF